MLDHVTIGASDRAASRRFYATVLPVLGCDRRVDDPAFVEWGDFSIAQADASRPVTTGLHLGFAASSPSLVEAFWQTGVDAGYASDGEPGGRAVYGPDYYGAFLLDPDGNSVEACLHDNVVPSGLDHLWIRVAELSASRTFYRAIADAAGFQEVASEPSLSRYRRAVHQSSFTIVADERPVTSPFHLAFGVQDHATVERFHADAVRAGYASNGEPGERTIYHPGYYGAFVIDADGHNVETVDHGRRPR